jgi:hypothetical protein
MSQLRYTEGAEYVAISFFIPKQLPSSFKLPIVKVEYKLKMEFYLSAKQEIEPMSFDVPIELYHQWNKVTLRQLEEDEENCIPYANLVQLAMESHLLLTPIVELVS